MTTPDHPFHLVIAISCHNEAANIAQLLQALISQEQTGFELKTIYVVSDGSTDRTVERATAINDKRIHCLTHSDQKGRSVRNNQILDLAHDYDGILFLEADTLPTDTHYLERLVTTAKQLPFSVIVGNSIPTPPQTFFSRVMNLGYTFRREIFEHATHGMNVYLCNGQSGLLLSHQFAHTFRWDPAYHDDSYCYRKSLNSNLPIRRVTEAKIYFRSVQTLGDYLLQSGKFHKAKEQEMQQTAIYTPTVSWTRAAKLVTKYLIASPVLMLTYLSVMMMSFGVSRLLPNYSQTWRIYKSSKTVQS